MVINNTNLRDVDGRFDIDVERSTIINDNQTQTDRCSTVCAVTSRKQPKHTPDTGWRSWRCYSVILQERQNIWRHRSNA